MRTANAARASVDALIIVLARANHVNAQGVAKALDGAILPEKGCHLMKRRF